jgi:hypothetical protein
MFLTGCKELSVPPEECFGVTDAVSGIQAAEAGGMAALGLSRAHDEELLATADPDVLVTSLDDVGLDTLAEAAGSEGRLIAADHARRGEIATDDLRIVAARAGFELELHSDGVCSSWASATTSPRVTIAHRCETPVFRVNAHHLSERSYGADRRLRLDSSCPTTSPGRDGGPGSIGRSGGAGQRWPTSRHHPLSPNAG